MTWKFGKGNRKGDGVSKINNPIHWEKDMAEY